MEEFKQGMNGVIRRKMMEAEWPPKVSKNGMRGQPIWINIEGRVGEKRKDKEEEELKYQE